jgi:hypothetical protein
MRHDPQNLPLLPICDINVRCELTYILHIFVYAHAHTYVCTTSERMHAHIGKTSVSLIWHTVGRVYVKSGIYKHRI